MDTLLDNIKLTIEFESKFFRICRNIAILSVIFTLLSLVAEVIILLIFCWGASACFTLLALKTHYTIKVLNKAVEIHHDDHDGRQHNSSPILN